MFFVDPSGQDEAAEAPREEGLSVYERLTVRKRMKSILSQNQDISKIGTNSIIFFSLRRKVTLAV